MTYLGDGACPDHDLVPVPWPDHSVVWIERSQQPHYHAGLRMGSLVTMTCAVLVLVWMLLP
ncbi:hypothetical protein [Cupriavidus necator]|uniref:hypothetical protein n=1 Tax=Cupriavidus necator TaxID=106590 RepID=UPI0005B30A4E|nr:hypothetical protein [Cupriavidus necator]